MQSSLSPYNQMKCLYGDIYKCTSELVAPAETCHSYLTCAIIHYILFQFSILLNLYYWSTIIS